MVLFKDKGFIRKYHLQVGQEPVDLIVQLFHTMLC